MLSIAQSETGYYCFQWISTEKGPRIHKYKYVDIQKDINSPNILKKVINLFDHTLDKKSISLAITLNINNVSISSFKIDERCNLKKTIAWYESTVLDKIFLKNHEMFYYPINDKKNKEYLVLSIENRIKENIIKMVGELDFNLTYLSVDIFSSAIAAKQLFKIKDTEDMLIWKVGNNNTHYFAFYNNNNFSSIKLSGS